MNKGRFSLSSSPTLTHQHPPARVLSIAGSDSSGGAGIQADIKTITCLGAYASTAITALTAQNTLGVTDILAAPEEFVREQVNAVLSDIGTDAIKTGMLHNSALIRTVADCLARPVAHGTPLVVDPVMVAKGGATLLELDAIEVLVTQLLPMATLITPNIPEASLLTNMEIDSPALMQAAAEHMLKLGAKAVLVKGGHLPGETIPSVLATQANITVFPQKRIDTPHTHGTGCTLASAIATGLAQKMKLEESVERAMAYVEQAIIEAPGFGSGHGPLRHNFMFED